jgi:putative heme transporter
VGYRLGVIDDVSADSRGDADVADGTEPADDPPIPSTGRRIRSILVRITITLAALALSAFLLSTVFDELDWSTIWASVRGLSDAERIALVSGAGLLISAQGLVTSATMKGLPVRRGILAYLVPASVASIVPGPSDLPVRFRMYSSWGYTPAEAGLAVTASGIFSIGTKLIMPVLAAVVALVAGVGLGDGVGGTIVFAGVVLGILIVLTSVVLGSQRLTEAVGYWLQAPWTVAARLLKKESGPLADTLASARSRAVTLLQDRWQIATWAAFLYASAQVGLMLMAVRFMGVPEEALGSTQVFIAFGIVQGLTVLPVTAGNVGVSETAWIGLMGAMAGSGFINEVTAAVIVFRALTWLAIIPLGGIGLLVWQRGVRRQNAAASSRTSTA